jgi:hypothetical protein
MLTVEAEKDHVVCEVCTEVKEAVFVIETGCAHPEFFVGWG